ncbi:uncharacterized protein LOC128670992 [Plodia interpunctella]|uniref:uncharacterized protein LOC128670992 n=1 Tax=Plodia interpunctella TaxID=58824 RepID=UPI003100CBC8
MLNFHSVLPLEILLQTIVNQYFNVSYCLTILAESSINCQYPVSYTYISVSNKNENLTKQILEASEKGCSDYIVRLKSPEIFIEYFEEVNHLGNTRRSDRKIVILPFQEDKSHADKLLNILSLNQTSFVANLLMIIPSHNVLDKHCQTFDLVTHKYVGANDEISQPVYIDQWRSCTQKFRDNINLFPHDMSNLYGKTVKVAAFSYEPYIILDIDEAIEPIGRDGTEVRLVDEFCRL